MKNLIIIGAGGMGREVYNLATQCKGFGTEYLIKGFIDDNPLALNNFDSYPPICGTISDYVIDDSDIFTCSIGNVQLKRKCIELILNKRGRFISLIHPTSLINFSSRIGNGSLIFPYAQVGSAAIIGDYSLVQSYAGIGHDVMIGDFARIDVQVLCVGGVKIGNNVTIHSGAIINHRVVIEDNAVIGATSFVIKKVKQGTTVFGNPAREI